MRSSSTYLATLVMLVATASALAQVTGPDVIVGEITGTSNHGAIGGISAYSFGTTSCNVGTANLSWVANTNQHPVIAQNLYRLQGGRFEQIGLAWLKHGFAALTGNVCNTCQNPGTSQMLGVGCSDPYGASLNGSQSGLGPRSEVNAATGAYPYPFGTGSGIQNSLSRRLQVANSDLDPAQNPGALYFAEAHYVTPDDAAAGNKNNNASWRPASFAASGSTYNMTLGGATVRTQPAIYAWRQQDPNVVIDVIDVPNDGRLHVGHTITPIGGGLVRVEFAIHNLSSDRSVGSFQVLLPPGAVVSNVGFHDVDYHSGEPFAGSSWSSAVTGSDVTWQTTSFGSNPNANAIRWGSLYNFRFDCTVEPEDVVIGLFKPGTPSSIPLHLCPPPVPVPPGIGSYTLDQSAAYEFTNIAGMSTSGPTSDDGSVTANLGFTFPFYGNTATQVIVSANGYVTFPGQAGGVFNNPSIPNSASPNGVIAGYWDDLNPAIAGSGQISYATVGTAPNRSFVVHYNGVYRFNTTQPENFQIILHENGSIATTIVASANGGASATRGIEDPSGTGGIQASFNTAGSAVAGTTWRYNRQTNIIPSATLEIVGNGAPNTFIGLYLHSAPLKPIVILGDAFPGVTPIPGIGTSGLAFSPALFPVADAIGAFGFPNPAAYTDICGEYTIGTMSGPFGLPSGFTLYFEGYVIDPEAPNGVLHFTNVAVLSIP